MSSMDEFLKAVQEIDPLWSVVLVAAALGVLLVAKLWRPAFAYIFAGVVAFAVVGGIAGRAITATSISKTSAGWKNGARSTSGPKSCS